jgi:hypothetical protein
MRMVVFAIGLLVAGIQGARAESGAAAFCAQMEQKFEECMRFQMKDQNTLDAELIRHT